MDIFNLAMPWGDEALFPPPPPVHAAVPGGPLAPGIPAGPPVPYAVDGGFGNLLMRYQGNPQPPGDQAANAQGMDWINAAPPPLPVDGAADLAGNRRRSNVLHGRIPERAAIRARGVQAFQNYHAAHAEFMAERQDAVVVQQPEPEAGQLNYQVHRVVYQVPPGFMQIQSAAGVDTAPPPPVANAVDQEIDAGSKRRHGERPDLVDIQQHEEIRRRRNQERQNRLQDRAQKLRNQIEDEEGMQNVLRARDEDDEGVAYIRKTLDGLRKRAWDLEDRARNLADPAEPRAPERRPRWDYFAHFAQAAEPVNPPALPQPAAALRQQQMARLRRDQENDEAATARRLMRIRQRNGLAAARHPLDPIDLISSSPETKKAKSLFDRANPPDEEEDEDDEA
jgi:hypothetical protein